MSEREKIEAHMSPDRPLRDEVHDLWMADHRSKYATDEDADAAFDAHWAKVSVFLDWVAEQPTKVLL